jgi:AAHS family 4-hydroxybenzoate transporter-like MFS transporter
MSVQGGSINITRAIDEQRMGALQVGTMILCSLVAFLDGLDTQTIGVAAPAIADTLGLSRAALGPVFSAALLGAMIGALTFGPLADRFGRKRILVLATVVFGVFTLATAYATSFESLLAVRFLAGIGLGGATPCFIALTSEYAPKRRRAMVTSLIWAAFPLGAALGAVLSSAMIAKFTWQHIFIVGGALPLIVAAAALIWLPESIRFLLAKGQDGAQARKIASRIVRDLPPNARITADEERVSGAPLKHLFSEGRALGTVLLWVPFLTAFGTLAIVVLWAPTLMRGNGIPLPMTGLVLGVSAVGVLVGSATAGRLMERFGVRLTLVPCLILGAVVTSTMGYAATSVLSMSIALILFGAFLGVGSSGVLALAALLYPTAIRSTGVGWAMGMGRLGQVLAPLATAWMIVNQWSNTAVFVAIAFAPFVGALSILLLGALDRSNQTMTSAARA